MKLDRNENADGHGKYALINVRLLYQPGMPMEVLAAIQLLADKGVLEWGAVGTENEFFPIKLKDRHAAAALRGYAASINGADPEFAKEVLDLADRAGPNSPWCKDPD